ncbi:hypothetical protein BU26DRAFT_250021 [Trematosphaeria pertusa]|uniref:Uncharacterized protein n=1 Tax=Trematosphaeria pertusa TaxID=390896 RepID=A0A6A6IP86_9PLEO|nr:uncharacterized protein BU26DRAFT_250021 [Trematosphaeria pertusa]KAF2252059.1 hypothetical protein BU26DRAFT_250021 [Trematosphaeria pertusa]
MNRGLHTVRQARFSGSAREKDVRYQVRLTRSTLLRGELGVSSPYLIHTTASGVGRKDWRESHCNCCLCGWMPFFRMAETASCLLHSNRMVCKRVGGKIPRMLCIEYVTRSDTPARRCLPDDKHKPRPSHRSQDTIMSSTKHRPYRSETFPSPQLTPRPSSIVNDSLVDKVLGVVQEEQKCIYLRTAIERRQECPGKRT